MKFFLKKVIAFFNKMFIYFCVKKINVKGNYFYFFKIKASQYDNIELNKSSFIRTNIKSLGNRNNLIINSACVSDSLINIEGDNNQIIFDECVNLHSSTLIVRGDNCSIKIGRNTRFGSVRIVNAGSNCSITIGEGCMFADHIEIWASDTHPIYNKNNEIINLEKPVTIGNKVWVGARVIILKGVTIADNSVIGMGAIVTRDVPANSITVGNPNRIIKNGVTWSVDPN